MTTAVAVIAVVSFIVAANFAWRVASRRWSLPCPSWLSWGLEGSFFSWLYGTETTLDRMHLKPGQRVLEIGPGPGRLLLPAARRVLPGGEAVGIDIQAPMIAKLEARAARAGTDNLTAIVGDAAEVVPPGKFDVVFLALTMGEIPRQDDFLGIVFAALKPGGRLSITELFPDPHFISQRALRAVVEEAGFQHQETLGSRIFYTSNFLRPARGRSDLSADGPQVEG